jgi:hypothetical protein
MIHLFTGIKNKLNGIIWSLLGTGALMLMLAVLVVWTDFMLRLVCGMFFLLIAYSFIYGAYKLYAIKKEIEEHFKI